MSDHIDRETTAAVEALAHRIRVRDVAIRDGEDYDDAEPFAREFLTALRGRSWRPVDALAKPQPADRASPNDAWQQARAALEQKLHRPAGEVA